MRGTRRSFIGGLAAAALPAPVFAIRDRDGSALIERAIAQVTGDNRSGTATLDGEDYVLTRPVVIERVWGLTLRGQGDHRTRLLWRGRDPSQHAVIVRNGFHTEVTDLRIVAEARCTDLVHVENAGGNPVPSLQGWRRLFLTGKMAAGVRYAKVVDANSEWGDFEKVKVEGASEASFVIGHSQAKAHTFRHCVGGGGRHIVKCEVGSFRWYDGGGGYCTESDFYLGGNPFDNILIQGADLEGSKRLIVADGSTSAPWPTTIRDIRWSGNKIDPTDRRIVIWKNPGPLSLYGGVIGEGAGPLPLISMGQTWAPSAFVCKGVGFLKRDQYTESPFDLDEHSLIDADIGQNVYGGAAGTGSHVPRTIPNGTTVPLVFHTHTYYTANTRATTISGFSRCWHGKRVTINVTDAFTSFRNGSFLWLRGNTDYDAPEGTVVAFEYATFPGGGGGRWREVSRSETKHRA